MTSLSKKRLVISYLVLVGIPLLGMVGVLKTGRRLTAPISIEGSWGLQVEPSANESQLCVAGLVSMRPTILDISQSGRYVTLTLTSQHRVVLQGTLQGKTLFANLNLPLEADCSGATGLSFTAEIDPKVVPHIMFGILSFDGCPSCGTANFQAVRQVLPTERRSE